jgi:hypothetical protein
MKREMVTLELNEEEAEFLAQALEIYAARYLNRISFAEELDQRVRTRLEQAFSRCQS